MKKSILILVAIFTITIAKSASLDSTIKSAADTSLTFKTVYSDIKSGISALAAGLKVGAEHVYEVLVKQQVANSITYLLMVIILFILVGIGYRLSKKSYQAHMALKGAESHYNWSMDSSSNGVASVVIAIITALLFIGAVVMFCTNFNLIVTGFVNPEYGAIKEILSFVK